VTIVSFVVLNCCSKQQNYLQFTIFDVRDYIRNLAYIYPRLNATLFEDVAFNLGKVHLLLNFDGVVKQYDITACFKKHFSIFLSAV